MSQARIDRIKEFLTAEGFIEGESFEVSASGRGSDSVTISVDVEIDGFELPEELRPFEQDADEVDRMIWKGNTEKKTWEGGNFELALRAYAGSIQEQDPEYMALQDRVLNGAREDLPTMEEWETQRAAIWKRICSDPKIAAWEHELNTRFH